MGWQVVPTRSKKEKTQLDDQWLKIKWSWNERQLWGSVEPRCVVKKKAHGLASYKYNARLKSNMKQNRPMLEPLWERQISGYINGPANVGGREMNKTVIVDLTSSK